MIIYFDTPEEFQKFIKIADTTRYVCYRTNSSGFVMLRPIKSSKHLDTGIYTGLTDKKLDETIMEKYSMIIVSEINLYRE